MPNGIYLKMLDASKNIWEGQDTGSDVVTETKPGLFSHCSTACSCWQALAAVSLLDSNLCCLKMVLQGKQIWDHKLEREVASPCVSAASESLCPHPKLTQRHLCAETRPTMWFSLSLRGLSTHWVSQPHRVFYCSRIFRYAREQNGTTLLPIWPR